MGIAGKQEDPARGCQYEQDTNQRLLNPGPALLGPVQANRRDQRGTDSDDLYLQAFRVPLHCVSRNHAEAGDLRDCEVNKYDAALQHFLAERYMCAKNNETCNQCRADDAPVNQLSHRPLLRSDAR